MFQYRAQKRTGKSWSIINIADGGNTLAMCVTQLPASLAALPDSPEPDVALFNVGANDVEGALIEATWKNNLRTYVETLHAKYPSTPIRIALIWREDEDADCDLLATWITAVAGEYAYTFVGMDERTWFKDHPELWYSGLGTHYDGAGQIQCALQWETNVFG